MSNPLSILVQSVGHVAVEGDMTFNAIDKDASGTFEFLMGSKVVTVDLAGVNNADSAGLALIFEWIKYARSKRVQLRIKNIPTQILNLAKLSGLEKFDYFNSTHGSSTVSS